MKWFDPYRKLTDEELMSLIANGKSAGLKELYYRYNRKLLYYFFRMLGGDEEKAQDFLQDLFLKIVEKPQQFNSKLKFSTWLFSIASNMCKNEYRRLKVREIIENEHDIDKINKDDQNHEQELEHKFFEDAIQSELMLMDSEQRSTFLLRYQESYSIKEISDILSCAPGTVKSRLFYVTRKLASRLKEYNPNIFEEIAHE